MNSQLMPDGIEPDIDMRLTAMVLGEASDFETSQLHELMNQRPELAAWYGQLQILHGALNHWAMREQGKVDESPVEFAEEIETWKLGADQRAKVLAILEQEPSNNVQHVLSVPTWQKRLGRRLSAKWLVISASAAACFVLLCSFLMLSASTKARYTVSQKSPSYSISSAQAQPLPSGPAMGAPASSTSGSSRSTNRYRMEDRTETDVDSTTLRPGAGLLELGEAAQSTDDKSGSMMGGDRSMPEAAPAPAPAPDVSTLDAAAPADSPAEVQTNGALLEIDSLAGRLGDRSVEPLADATSLPSFSARSNPIGLSSGGKEQLPQKQDFVENLPNRGVSGAEEDQKGDDFRDFFDTSEMGGLGGMAGKPSGGRMAGGGRGASSPGGVSPSAGGTVPATGKSIEKKESGSGESMQSLSLGYVDGREIEELRLAEDESKQKRNLSDKLALKDAEAEDSEPGAVAGENRKLRRDLREKAKLAAGLSETLTETERFSTFSLHVSDVSFKLAFDALSKGQWPDASKIRLEEFLNAFDYQDPLPAEEEKVACRIEQAIHPFLMQRNVLRVAMRTSAVGRNSGTPLRLTLLLDNSGSMQRADRAETIRRAFETLAAQLTAQDEVTLISFANEPKLRADRVKGKEILRFVDIVENSPVEGGTNIEAALRLAFEKSVEAKTLGTQSRVILMTDGAVNLGDADPNRLSQIVLQMRDNGIAFDAAGISAQDLNDEVLEALARKGDGRYYLLDNAEQVDAGFAQQIAGALRPSAKNVKVQVEFNPQRVRSYKLLGFEKHLLNKEDFRNDKVDAAELAAAEAGIALYHYEVLPDGVGDVGSVSVRFQDMATGLMVERRWPIAYEKATPRLEFASSSLKLATSAVLFAAHLKGEPVGESVDLKFIAEVLGSLDRSFGSFERVEQLRRMIESARQIAGASSGSR